MKMKMNLIETNGKRSNKMVQIFIESVAQVHQFKPKAYGKHCQLDEMAI